MHIVLDDIQIAILNQFFGCQHFQDKEAFPSERIHSGKVATSARLAIRTGSF